MEGVLKGQRCGACAKFPEREWGSDLACSYEPEQQCPHKLSA